MAGKRERKNRKEREYGKYRREKGNWASNIELNKIKFKNLNHLIIKNLSSDLKT